MIKLGLLLGAYLKSAVKSIFILCCFCTAREIDTNFDLMLLEILKFEWINEKYFDAVIGLLPAIFAISMPLLIGTLSKNIEEYKDAQIWNLLLKQKEIHFQFYLMPFFICILIIFSFVGIHQGFGAIFVIIFVIYIIYRYIIFIKYLMHLSTNVHNEILKISLQEVNNEIKTE